MDWFKPSKTDVKQIEHFLKKREHLCINLCELYLEKGLRLIEEGGFLIGRNRYEVCGVLGTDFKGHILPMIDGDLTPTARKTIEGYLAGLPKVISVMGPASSVDAVSRLVHRPVFKRIEYILMTASTRPTVSGPSRLSISTVKAKDIPQVFPLQEGYEKEEVLLEPDHFNKAVSMLLFKQKVKKYPHYMGLYGGEIVSMARINARGWSYSQIGGVYTLRSCRNLGYAGETVAYLMNEIFKKGRAPALFVKTGNMPALALYRRLGFVDKSPFSIAYF